VSAVTTTVASMERNDPSLVASTETRSGVRFHRVEVEREDAPGPTVDLDDLLASREEERASPRRWIVEISGGWDELYWAQDGGYTSFRSNARRFPSRWDVIEYMRGRLKKPMAWRLSEDVPARVYPRRPSHVEQVWTGITRNRAGRRRPADGLVHGSLDRSLTTLCGQQVGSWRVRTWPPPNLPACPECSAAVDELQAQE